LGEVVKNKSMKKLATMRRYQQKRSPSKERAERSPSKERAERSPSKEKLLGL